MAARAQGVADVIKDGDGRVIVGDGTYRIGQLIMVPAACEPISRLRKPRVLARIIKPALPSQCQCSPADALVVFSGQGLFRSSLVLGSQQRQ